MLIVRLSDVGRQLEGSWTRSGKNNDAPSREQSALKYVPRQKTVMSIVRLVAGTTNATAAKMLKAIPLLRY